MKYVVTIEEFECPVEADSEEEAIEKVKDKIREQEIMASDFSYSVYED